MTYASLFCYPCNISNICHKPFEKKEWHTHPNVGTELIHDLSETLFYPTRKSFQFFAQSIEPLAGEYKDHKIYGLSVRITSIALLIFMVPIALVTAPSAFLLRCLVHSFRPLISSVDNSESVSAKGKIRDDFELTKEKPFHVRTHNLGFVTTSMSTVGDLRHPEIRAQELVKSIVEDPHKPDLICFQETFHENASRILCEGIKLEYPYIMHSIAPHISGFHSGAMIASKYPIEDIHFEPFNDMLGPERMAPRGIVRVTLQSKQGPISFYNVHAQALLGKSRAEARFKQLQQLKNAMDEEKEKKPDVWQVALGDLNTSRITAWGKDHESPEGQPEEKVLDRLREYFDDLFLKDHDSLGNRRQGNPYFLEADNHRMNVDLKEPTGSWYYGPFAEPGIFLSLKEYLEKWWYQLPEPNQYIELGKPLWGTPQWQKEQRATARFDYILVPRDDEQAIKREKTIEGICEIRRPCVAEDAQSASTDHFPIDARIWIQ